MEREKSMDNYLSIVTSLVLSIVTTGKVSPDTVPVTVI